MSGSILWIYTWSLYNTSTNFYGCFRSRKVVASCLQGGAIAIYKISIRGENLFTPNRTLVKVVSVSSRKPTASSLLMLTMFLSILVLQKILSSNDHQGCIFKFKSVSGTTTCYDCSFFVTFRQFAPSVPGYT